MQFKYLTNIYILFLFRSNEGVQLLPVRDAGVLRQLPGPPHAGSLGGAPLLLRGVRPDLHHQRQHAPPQENTQRPSLRRKRRLRRFHWEALKEAQGSTSVLNLRGSSTEQDER
jgi:hypothetical protein